jgi:hypothetical protein
MKYCPRCETVRTREEFHKASGRRDGLQPFCKYCKKVIDARTYAEGGEEYKRRKNREQHARAQANMRRLFEYLREHPCVDCGETDPLVLQFDHIRGEKKYNIGDLFHRYGSWRVIEEEIEKCEVCCANCHQRRTAARQGTFRYLLSLELESES